MGAKRELISGTLPLLPLLNDKRAGEIVKMLAEFAAAECKSLDDRIAQLEKENERLRSELKESKIEESILYGDCLDDCFDDI